MTAIKKVIKKKLYYILIIIFATNIANAQKNDKSSINQSVFSAFKFRSIGPGYISGRIADIEVNPNNHAEYYVGAAAGGVWKTTNNGITYKPVFDSYGSYSIADVAIDPNNTNIVWVGTGEYNSQRAIGYGDGVYVSFDGGKSFKNVGLTKSEHIGRIVIDKRNSDVYVAAQGPLWGPGGDRGLYKTTDKGKTWKKILKISENTGINDILIDPLNSNILYASSYQRRRRVFTLINGGDEGAIYKSEDAGKTWRKLTKGLPKEDMGRSGIAISPVDPNYVYAIVEADGKADGLYRSCDKGESWTKMSNYKTVSPQYYNRIFCDPKDVNKIYSIDTYSRYSNDGGKTWTKFGLKNRHVDDHAMWIDPDNTNHLLIGGDGGIYDTYDNGKNWRHAPNLPVTQYYRVAVDNSYPFYNICGGTQDNNSMFGPSRTQLKYGILNSEWTTTIGGDGFFSAFDPKDLNIIYSEYQYGGLARYNKKTGERVSIKPYPPLNEAYRWNWNAPVTVSSHLHTRLYFAANKLFKSDDRGNSWQVISPDLTRQLDRNKLKVMGKIQPADAIAKSSSTSLFGNIVSISESEKNENLLYVGTDDGLIQVTDDGGKNWRKESSFSGVPDMTYVSCVFASQHDENVVYAAFDGRKNNDLKPYLLKSTNKGKSWKSIISNLPKKGTVYSVVEDYKNSNLLFAGTEYGIFVTLNGGKKWFQLKSGIPTIAVRDIKIQRNEDDLVLATFGRGFYILDDFSVLRQLSEKELEKDILFPVRDALTFIQTTEHYGQGATYYAGKNQEFGATFTYYIKEVPKTLKKIRKEKEKNNKDGYYYPTFEELTKEQDEIKSNLYFVIKNSEGKTVRRIKKGIKKGLHKITWGLRYFNVMPVTKSVSKAHRNQSGGVLVAPGKYSVSLYKVISEKDVQVGKTQHFNVRPIDKRPQAEKEMQNVTKFKEKAGEVFASVKSLSLKVKELSLRVKVLKEALIHAPKSTNKDIVFANSIIIRLTKAKRALKGNSVISKRSGNQPPSINSRIDMIVYGLWSTNSNTTQTIKDNLKLVIQELNKQIKFVKLISDDIKKLEKIAANSGASFSRIPENK